MNCKSQMKRLFYLLSSIAFLSYSAFSQVIPLDPRVTTGKLENGLTYYIMPNSKPEKKVELRLVINVGSTAENDEQQGLAHFTEHMMFNGTKNFKKNELVDFLQSIGVKFGADLNAYTSFDETVYILPIPTDKPENINKGFQVLEDWAHNALLEDSEIDKERGVVLEEYRLGLGADKRMWENYLPIILKDSRYALRLPIGKKEILEKFSYEAIRQFYKDWYRPNLMSVIVVGDMTVAEAENKIKQHFSNLKNPENPRPLIAYRHPDVNEMRIAIESDKEATFNTLDLTFFQYGDPLKPITERDYLEILKKNIFSWMAYERYTDLTQLPDPPFSYAGAYLSDYFSRRNEALDFYAYFDNGKAEQAYKNLYREMIRIKKYGFNQDELNRAKSNLLANAEQGYNNRNKTESSQIVSELVSSFLNNSVSLGPEWNFNFLKNNFDKITIETINEMLESKFETLNNTILFTCNKSTDNILPDKDKILQWKLEVEAETITENKSEKLTSNLIETPPNPISGYTKKSTKWPGVNLITLKNGVNVYYKTTDFKDDEIVFSAQSFGGTSQLSDELFLKTNAGLGWLGNPTLKGMNPPKLNKVISGKNVNLNAYVSTYTEGLYGGSDKKDLETFFQWIHLYFTSIENNEEDYLSYASKQKLLSQNQLKDPSVHYQTESSRIMSGNHLRFRYYPTEEDWKRQDVNSIHTVMKERFANVADFNFIFIGNIEETKFVQLCETYLATLPATGVKEKLKDLKMEPKVNSIDTTFYKGSEQKSSVKIIFSGKAKYNAKMHTCFLV
jgi:zinc protease